VGRIQGVDVVRSDCRFLLLLVDGLGLTRDRHPEAFTAERGLDPHGGR
jgi:hypothetical protein